MLSGNQGCDCELMLGYAYADMKTDACDRMWLMRSPEGLSNPKNTKSQQGLFRPRRVR